MTAEQPSHFRTMLNGLFEGNGATVNVRLECSSAFMLFLTCGGAVYPGYHCGGSLLCLLSVTPSRRQPRQALPAITSRAAGAIQSP